MEYFNILWHYIAIISMTNIYSAAKKEPININKYLIMGYNITNSLINLYVAIRLSKYILNSSIGMNIPIDDTVKYCMYIHYLCKYLDFTDTVIMILKHNWKQVNILQLFHHATIGVVWLWVYNESHNVSSTVAFGVFANSFIHFLMYLHYFVTTMGINNPFKRYMTMLQMIQFSMGLIHAIYAPYYQPELIKFGIVQALYMVIMLILFYIYVYKTPTKTDSGRVRKENKKLILNINGTHYDATEFKSKHPGGNIIANYDINIVPDATDAFNTFHVRSAYAFKMLKSLPVIESNDKIPSDFQVLINNWKIKGFYNLCVYEYILWSCSVFLVTLSGYICLLYDYPILGGLIVGIGWAHCGFVQHHAGHLGFTGIPEIDYLVQSIFECILKGGSARWWRNRHNKHHAMPNSIEYDGDLRTTPFFAWDDILIKKIPTALLKIQHILFIPMLVLYVPVFFITTKLYVIRNKYWDELGLICIHFYLSLMFYTTTYNFILFYCIGYAIQGLYLGIMFGVNHFTMTRVLDNSTDWFRWQITSTCNWGGKSIFAQYISGFLNLQIEHHVAPQLAPQNYKFIIDDIKEYASKHGLKYIDITFSEAFYNLLNGLKMCADKELALRNNKYKL